jgi:hypothetical protein
MRITVRQAGTAAVLGLSGTPSTFPDSTKRIAGFLAEGTPSGAGGGCSMMSGMMGGGMMGMGSGQSDPRTMQMRGEMMKAMGEIMMKYGKLMEGSGR